MLVATNPFTGSVARSSQLTEDHALDGEHLAHVVGNAFG